MTPGSEIAELREDLDQLTQAVCPALRQTLGVGVDNAATLLTAAGDNSERLRSEAGFAALCGANPLPASSGKTSRHRLNRGGNRQANTALHRIAVVRLRWDQQTQAYADRRIEEGLSKPEILRCLKRFIAREVVRILMGGPSVRMESRTNLLDGIAETLRQGVDVLYEHHQGNGWRTQADRRHAPCGPEHRSP